MKKVLLPIIIVLAVVADIFLFSNSGVFGKASSNTENPTNTQQVTTTDSQNDNSSPADPNKDANIILVLIKENQVFVDGKECKDEEELKAYVQELYNDEKIFELEDSNSILATYEWVEKVFCELSIELVPILDN